MKTSPIIMLCGSAGSGKDTAANFIQQIMPKTGLIAQAEPLKMIGESFFGFSKEQLWGPSECRNAPDPSFNNADRWQALLNRYNSTQLVVDDWLQYCGIPTQHNAFDNWLVSLYKQTWLDEKPLTPRIMLQTLGTEFGRLIDPNIWNRIAMDKSKERLLSGEANIMIITDGRFKNEILNTKLSNGMAVYVLSPEGKDTSVGVKGHASEEELKKVPFYWFDEVIVNNKRLGLDFYKNQMEQFCTKYFKDVF